MISRHLSESRAKSKILPTRKCNSSWFVQVPSGQKTERMVRIFNCLSFVSHVHASLCCCCSIPDPEIDLIQSFTRTRSFQRRPPLFQNKSTLIINNPLKLSLQNSHIAPVPPWGAWFCGDSHPVVYPQRFARCPPYHQAWHQTNGLKWTKLDFFKRNTLTYTPIKSCGNKKARFMTFDVTTLIWAANKALGFHRDLITSQAPQHQWNKCTAWSNKGTKMDQYESI